MAKFIGNWKGAALGAVKERKENSDSFGSESKG